MIKVLVVDDSALMRKLCGRILTGEAGFELQYAKNGAEALALNHSFRPDVITLDVQMPVMDGLACLDRIMLERPCPVVMVSSLTAEGAEATLEALRLGAIDFVPKPAGALSLRLEAFAPALLQKIRTAATARVRASRRLRERVQFRMGGGVATARAGYAPAAKEHPARRPAASGDGLVLVGTSTGGPPALEALLAPLPASFPWPLLVAQHMPAAFTAPLAARLNDLCALQVVEVTRLTELTPGVAYIGRGDADLVVSRRNGTLMASMAPPKKDYLWHPSTDRLVTSAMTQVAPAQLIGVLMTGMGDDGAAAMTALHAAGGATIAEAEETAVVWGMPGELVKAGGADWVEPLPRIAQRLVKLVPVHATT